MATREQRCAEIERNYSQFLMLKDTIDKSHENDFVIMKDGRIIQFCQTILEADSKAKELFQDGIYSIQQVNPKPVELGFFSHAINPRVA